MRLVLLGPPGSGKGTQGAKLAERYGAPHIATGDIIRDNIARKTDFGRKVETAIAEGNFAPDPDVLNAVSERIAQEDAQKGYILDGFPRDIAQAAIFDDLLAVRGEQLDAVIELDVEEAALMERISGRRVCPQCGAVYHLRQCPPRSTGTCDLDGTPLLSRPDDQPEAVKHRLEIYEAVTLPLTAYYRSRNRLVQVDGSGDVDEVTHRIIQAVDGFIAVDGL